MIQFCCRDLLEHLDDLRKVEGLLREAITTGKASEQIDDEDAEKVYDLIKKLSGDCIKLELDKQKAQLGYLEFVLWGFGGSKSNEVVAHSLQQIINGIIGDLDDREFAYIPQKLTKYFENGALFGEGVRASFPLAEDDIKCAGNCMAAELYTAAVFHLMRVVTMGERALARSLGVADIGGKQLEFCRDAPILEAIDRAIEAKLKAMANITRDEAWEVENAFYRRLKTDLEYFKEIVRDPVAHARKTYLEPGALDVYNHVCGFMQRLAERVRE